MREVTLERGKIAKFDDGSPFFVEEGELELVVHVPERGEYFLVDGKDILPLPQDGRVNVGLKVGEWHPVVKRYVGGRLAGVYQIEPLAVKSVDAGVEAMPEISELQRAVVRLERELKAEREAREEALNKAVRDACVTWLGYAYNEYKNDVQLNANSLDMVVFAALFGVELTEEEMQSIKDKGEQL